MNQTNKIDILIIVLTALVTLLAILTIPLLNRLSSICGFHFSLSSLIMPFCYLLFDVVSEIYSRKIAIYLLFIAIFMVIFFVVIVKLLLLLPIPTGWNYENYYNFIFSASIRLSVFGPLSLLLSQVVNIYLISYFNQLVKGKFFWLRAIGACAAGELIVSYAGLFIYNTYGYETVIGLITVGYFIKVTATIALSPFITFIVTILKTLVINEKNIIKIRFYY